MATMLSQYPQENETVTFERETWAGCGGKREAIWDLTTYLMTCEEYKTLKYVGYVAARLSDFNWDADKLISQNLEKAQNHLGFHQALGVFPVKDYKLSNYYPWPKLTNALDESNVKLNAFLKYHYACGRFLKEVEYIDAKTGDSKVVFRDPHKFTSIIEKAFGQLYLYEGHQINAWRNDRLNYSSHIQKKFNEKSKVFNDGYWVIEDNIEMFRFHEEWNRRDGYKREKLPRGATNTVDDFIPQV